MNTNTVSADTADKAGIKVEVEAPSELASPDFVGLVNHLKNANPQHRETAACIIKNWGYNWHIGGRHVAVLSPTGVRLALVTHESASDWN